VIRRPNATDTLVDTRDRLLGPLVLLAAVLLQEVRLLEDLLGLEIPHADGLFAAVDEVAFDDGVLVWSRGYADFDLRVLFGEGCKMVLQEGPENDRVSILVSQYPALNSG
jgi:hypothetical protein